MLTSPGIVGQSKVATDVIMLEYDETIDITALPDNVNLLVDYENGRALVEVSGSSESIQMASGIRVLSMPDRTFVNPGVAGISFDWMKGEPQIPAELKAPSNSDAYIVKFIGPMQPGWAQDIRELGGKVGMYVANYGFVVRMDTSTKAKVSALPTVEWIGDYHPAYKIAPGILDNGGNVMISIIAFEGTDIPSLAAQLSGMGATIGQYVASDRTIKFTADSSLIPAIASLPEIEQMHPDGPKYPMDIKANHIHKAVDAWYPDWSGLLSGLDGSGEIVHIQDTGFDEGNENNGCPDFFDGLDGDRIDNYIDRTGSSDPDGSEGGTAHGTHVAGVVASNGWCWETWMGEPTNDYEWHKAEAAGVAPRANLVLDGCASGGGIASSSAYWNEAYTNFGARTMSNSYGGEPADYSAATADTQMAADDRMIIFSAGNYGPDPDSLSPGSQAKNGLCAGKCENYRPNQYSADNPNVIPDFSGRGGTFSNGRIKPDLVAVGTSVIGNFARGEWDYNVANGIPNPQPGFIMEVDVYPEPFGDGFPDYRYMGTSGSAPMAAGLYLLCREYLREIEGIANPPSELTKAMLVNGCDKMTEELYVYPGYDQGWGRPNLKNSLFPDAPATVQYDTNTFAAVGPWTPAFTTDIVSGDVPLKATLVWKDTSGVALARDLDLRITAPGGDIFYGNSFTSTAPYWSQANSPANRPSADHGNYDGINNVEQVWIESPEVGTWTVEVDAFNVPSNTPCAIVMSADVGPQGTYSIDLATESPTTLRVAPNGNTAFQFRAFNHGTLADSIVMSDDSPFTISYSPASPFAIDSGDYTDVIATISAGAISPGVYDFRLTGTSQGDLSKMDTLFLKVDVVNQALPFEYEVTTGTADEVDPSVVTFTDALSTSHIFISYIKTTANEKRVWVTHTTLNAGGRPVEPWTEFELPAPAAIPDYERPSDPRIYVMDSGLYEDRVFVVWTGWEVGAGDTGSSSYISYADGPAYGTWSTVRIDINSGTNTYNLKRVNFLCPRPGSNQLLYCFEHIDYPSIPGVPSGADVHGLISNDGGATWIDQGEVTPADGNFYFFPNGCVDQNGVCWIFYYWRVAADRDMAVRLYDGAWQVGYTDVTDTTDNVVDPAPWSTNEGASGNRVYCAFLRDQGTSEYTLWTSYIDGDYTSASPPPDFWAMNGPFGSDISISHYDRGPVLSGEQTGDGFSWVVYKENDNLYGYDVPQMDTICSDSGFATNTIYDVTADSHSKGHQMMSTLTLGGDNVYEVYHSSDGDLTDVNYNIQLIVYVYDWPNDPDLDGPLVTSIMANPNPAGLGYTFNLSANIDDISTGLSGIQAAEYYIDQTLNGAPVEPTWIEPGVNPLTLSGISQSETATANGLSIPFGAQVGDWFYVWVRGQDTENNWGDGAYVKVVVTDGLPPPTVAITYPTGSELIERGTCTITWTATDSLDPPEDLYMYIDYTTDDGGSWNLITEGLINPPAGPGSHSWDTVAAGVPDGVNYLIRVTAVNGGYMLVGINETLPFSIDNTVDDQWFFQMEISGPNEDLDMKPVEGSVNTIDSTGLNTPGQYLVGMWETTKTFTSASIDGLWTFNVYGYTTDPGTLVAYLYANVTDGTGATIDVTVNDGENVGAHTGRNLFTWPDTLAGAIPDGQSIIVELWLDVQTSSGGPATRDVVPNDPEFTATYWDVDDTPPTGDRLNPPELPITESDVSVSENTRFTTDDPSTFDEIFVWCEVDFNLMWESITRFNMTFEGQSVDEASDFDLWVLKNTGWEATGDTINVAMDTDGTLYGEITVDCADYIVGDKFTWGVYQTTDSRQVRIDYLHTIIDYVKPDAVFTMEYDYWETQSNVIPTITGAGANTYNIPMTVPLDGSGWQFVSFPIDVKAHVLTIFDDDGWNSEGANAVTWDMIYWYDPTDVTDPWMSYNKNWAGAQDIPVFVTNHMGFWLHITNNPGGGDSKLTVGDSADPSGESVMLQIGWNLVGYPATAPGTAADLPGWGVTVTKIGYYNETAAYDITETTNGATPMIPGEAYWVYSTIVQPWNL